MGIMFVVAFVRFSILVLDVIFTDRILLWYEELMFGRCTAVVKYLMILPGMMQVPSSYSKNNSRNT
jgi:hypothetical protein